MGLEDAKTQVDHAFTRDNLRGLSNENTFGGATSFLRRRYTKDLSGVDLAITGVPFEHRLLAALGPEPFDQKLRPEYLYRLSRGKKVTVKQFIMDGKIVVGVGNIYASEALFRAGIRPGRAAGRVSHIAFARLLGEIRAVLSEAIEAGGTTLRDYSRVNGEPGYFEQSLNVYERAGLPCVNCEKIVQRKVIGQRASNYCPRCQT